MQFELCNAPAMFEMLMEQVLIRLPTSVALVTLMTLWSQGVHQLKAVFILQ